MRRPRAILLVTEEDQLLPSVPIEGLPRLWAERPAPIPDHAFAQEALPVLIARLPPRLVLEGKFVRYRGGLLRAQAVAGQLRDDSSQLPSGTPVQVLVAGVDRIFARLPATHEIRPRKTWGWVRPRETAGMGFGERVFDERRQVLVDV